MRKGTCEKCGTENIELCPCRLGEEYVMACIKCVPLIQKEQDIIQYERYVLKLIPPLFHKARLEHLSQSLQELIKSLPEARGLLLWGLPGRGKSYAMAAIMRHCIFQGKRVIRVNYENICMSIRDTFNTQSAKTELDIVEPLTKTDMLFIEDVGTTISAGKQESDFSLRTFLVLLNDRLENCKPTFITTNKSIEELSRSFDARIASRLLQACEIARLTGPDKREPAQT